MFVEPNLPMPLTSSTYEEMVSSWLKIIRYRESGVIIFGPKMDRLRRINQLLADEEMLSKYLSNYKKSRFLILNPDMVAFDEDESLKSFILEQLGENISGELKTIIRILSQKYQLVFLIINAERLFLERKEDYLANLAIQQIYNPSISILLLSETDLTHPDFVSLLGRYTVFCQNVYFVPIYSEKRDHDCYFSYLEKKWQIRLKTMIKNKIRENCFHEWLIKEAVRFLRDNPAASLAEVLNHENMRLKIKILFNAFLESEKEVFRKVVLKQPIISEEEKHSFEFLLKMNLLNNHKNQIVISCSLLKNYLLNDLKNGEFFLGSSNEIILNNICVSTFFSKKEKSVLSLMIKNKGEIVSRENIAREIWGVDFFDNYSDWTIDQTISRLRRKIGKLGISPKILKTIKKQGFLLLKGR